MRVKIEHEPQRIGWPFKKSCHEVHLTVDFTHEEKQIIRLRELLEHPIMDRMPFDAKPDDNPDWFALKVGHLLTRRPDKFRCRTPSDAKRYAVELQSVLQQLHDWLADNADLGTTLVFET